MNDPDAYSFGLTEDKNTGLVAVDSRADFEAWRGLASCSALFIPRSLFSLTAAAASGAPSVFIAKKLTLEYFHVDDCDTEFEGLRLWNGSARRQQHLGFP